MEKEYIERGALLEELQEEIVFESAMYTEEQNKWLCTGLRIATRDVRKQPTADVVPRDEVERIENEIFDNVKKIAQNAIDLFEKHAERAKGAYAASACHSNAVGAEVVLTEIAKYERRFKKKCTKGGEQDG